MNDKLAPFTPEEVVALTEYQRADFFHPFTCSNRGDGRHPELDGDAGILIATVRGWICQFCDYTQSWAHDSMADGSMMKNRTEQMTRLGLKERRNRK